MLILNRKLGESIMLGEEIVVTILSVRGNHITVSIDAPKEVAVHRKEIRECTQRDKSQPERTR